MNTKIGRSFISFCVLFTLCAALLSSAANAQQAEKAASPAPQKTSSQAQPDSAISRQNESPIVVPIVGKGTLNFLPVFVGTHAIGNSLVSQTGNGITVNGTVGAVSFSGDGSGLSNVTAVQLGGLPASAFAQQGASNNFTADQTITGNLNLTGYINNAFSVQGNLTDQNGQEGANVAGGFAGNPQYGGNSIAPGVIGATIGGGGGVYDPSLQPKHPARKQMARRAGPAGMDRLRNPFARRSALPGNSEQSAEPEAERERTLPPGLISGANTITANSNWATIGGGLQNTVMALDATVGGGYNNTALWSEATVAGGSNNTASDVNSTVGGGDNNTASGAGDGIGSATVAGGGSNSATGDGATVGGGVSNQARGTGSTVAGGGYYLLQGNNAGGSYATISGGADHNASGNWSTVPGGWLNAALGDLSFAAGCGATANYTGSFVWEAASGPSLPEPCQSAGNSDSAAGQFVVSAYGGFYFYTEQPGQTVVGAALPSGSGSWSNLSDRNVKTNFLAIDPSSLLKKLAAMPVATWNYKTQGDSIRHLGPTAQDFHEAFGLGEDDKHISTVDAEGVALAGIQALYAEMKSKLDEMNSQFLAMEREKDEQIAELRQRLSHVEQSGGTH